MSYVVKLGSNGKKYVQRNSVGAVFHATDGNSKTGPCGNYNLPIEYTCDHRCNCYLEGSCYACGGCYQFPGNQALYSENYNFYKAVDNETMIALISAYIVSHKLTLWRYFTIGDIPDMRFIDIMAETARRNPNVKFWAYTKKYAIVNGWLYMGNRLPENLVIIFSHWLNDDGSYFHMENDFNLPTSEFIPLGREELLSTVTHVCPCSDPNVKATCATCDHPCYTLKHGESMALVEHSTKRTKARDKMLKEAKAKLAARKA